MPEAVNTEDVLSRSGLASLLLRVKLHQSSELTQALGEGLSLERKTAELVSRATCEFQRHLNLSSWLKSSLGSQPMSMRERPPTFHLRQASQ